MKNTNLTPIESYIEEDFGAVGTPERNEFELSCDAFILGEQLRAERLRAGLTQSELASRVGTKKSYISRIENGHADIQLTTLIKLFQGLDRKISIAVI